MNTPDNISIYEEHGLLVIRRKWSITSGVISLIVCLGFFFIVYAPDAQIDPIFVKVRLPVCLFLAYLSLAYFKNSTYVYISPETVRVKISPIKWWGEKELRVENIKQFFGRETTRRTKNGTTTDYYLSYRTTHGEEGDLLSGLDGPEQIYFIEKQLEDTLGIRDDNVYRH